MEPLKIRMHAEELPAGLRTGLLDQHAGTLLLEHLLAQAERWGPGGLGATYIGVLGERISLAELRRHNHLGLLAPRAVRQAMHLLLGRLKDGCPGSLRSLELELEFTVAPTQSDGMRLDRLLVVHLPRPCCSYE